MAPALRSIFGNPTLAFSWFDLLLVVCVYVLSVVLFLRRKRGYFTPLLVFGLFLFPVQFSIWFLAPRAGLVFYPDLHVFEVAYLFFLKACLIATILSPRT